MNRVLRLILFISLLFVFFIAVFRLAGTKPPAALALEVMGRFESAAAHAASAVEDFWQGYFALVNARAENKQLKQTVALLRSQVHVLFEERYENQRLKSLLSFAPPTPLPTLGATVVSWDPNRWFKSIVINRGSRHGVRPGMPVVNQQGVVGRVVGVSASFAKVLLLIDYHSSVDAMAQRSRVRGIMAGESGQLCALRYVLKNDDVARGDQLVTSGLGGVFPKGLNLGRVLKVVKSSQGLFLEVDVKPAVDFKRLEEVLVVLIEDRNI